MKRWLSALTALIMVCTLALGGPAWSLAEEMPGETVDALPGATGDELTGDTVDALPGATGHALTGDTGDALIASEDGEATPEALAELELASEDEGEADEADVVRSTAAAVYGKLAARACVCDAPSLESVRATAGAGVALILEDHNQWLRIAYDGGHGVETGYVPSAAVSVLSPDETQAFMNGLADSGEVVLYEGDIERPLGAIACEPVGDDDLTAAAGLLGEEADLIIAASREAEAVAPFAASEMILGVGERWSVKPGGEDANYMYYIDTAVSDAGCVALSASGIVTGLGRGVAVICATTAEGETFEDVCTVTVQAAPAKVTLIAGTWRIGVGEVYDGLAAKLEATEGEDGCAGSVVWTSSDPGVIAVDAATGVVTGVAEGTADVTARAYNGRRMTCRLTVRSAPTSIGLEPESIDLSVDRPSAQLVATVPGGTASGGIAYVSSDESVAVVSETGLVTMKGEGSAVIAAMTYNGLSAECAVTVHGGESRVEFDESELTLGVGQKGGVHAAAYTGDGSATDVDVSYFIAPSSPNPDCVSLNTVTGEVTAKKRGTAIIGVHRKGKAAEAATCTVYVTVAPESLYIRSTVWTVGVGETYDGLTAVLNPPEGETSCEASVAWSSGDTAVLAVDRDTGAITGVSAGRTRLTARAQNGKTATCWITVGGAPESIELNKAALTLSLGGKSAQLRAKLSEGAVSAAIEFTSSNESVATVDARGVVSAVGAGEAVVTARTFNGKTAECAVTVFDLPGAVTLDKSELAMGVNERVRLTATATAADGGETQAELTFYIDEASPNPDCVTVNAVTGMVRALETGTAIIGVRTQNDIEASEPCVVTVCAAPSGVEISAPYWRIGVGERCDGLSARLVGNGGAEVAGGITWISSSPDIVKIDASTGAIEGLKPGTTVVTARAYNGVSASHGVTVAAAPVSLAMSESAVTMLAGGEALQLNAVFQDGAASGSIIYTSSDPAVASVDANGLVTSGTVGEAVISAETFNGVTASCVVTVIEPPTEIRMAESISITDTHTDFPIAVLDVNGNAFLGEVTMRFEPEGYAVYEDGRMIGTQIGSTTFIVEAGGLSARCAVSVVSYRTLFPVLSIAHRGGCAYWPENTLTAFSNCASTGCEGAELDVQTTRDGVSIVNHNTTIVSGNKTYTIANCTYAQLKSVKSDLCTLDEAIDVIDKAGLDLHLELKETAIGAECVRIVREHNMQDRTVYFGFFKDQLKQVYAAEPTATIGLSLNTAPSNAELASLKEELHLSFLVMKQTVTTFERVNYWHTQDLKVCVWTVNDKSAVRNFCNMGVDYILSNYPNYCVEVR